MRMGRILLAVTLTLFGNAAVWGQAQPEPAPAPGHYLYVWTGDANTGALTLDEGFRDTDRKAGFSFADRQWPHGWKGSGAPHGAVFSR